MRFFDVGRGVQSRDIQDISIYFILVSPFLVTIRIEISQKDFPKCSIDSDREA